MVDRPANPAATVLLHKRAATPHKEKDTMFEKLLKRFGLKAANTPLDRNTAALHAALQKAAEAEDPEAAVKQVLEEFGAEVTKNLATLTKPDAPVDDADDELDLDEDTGEHATPSAVQKQVDAAVATLQKRHSAELAKRDSQIATLTKSVATLTENAQTVELKKRAADLAGTTGQADNLETLLKAAGTDAAAVKAVEAVATVLKKAQADAKMFQVVGGNDAMSVSQPEKVEKAVTDLMTADKKLTRPQAVKKVWEMHPDWYEEAQAAARPS